MSSVHSTELTNAHPQARCDRPLVVHVLDRFGRGGMETVALNLITHTREHYRHHVICLRERGELAASAEAEGATVEAIDKQPGKDWGAYRRLWHRLRCLSPDIVHTYNIGAVDAAFWARLAGVRRIMHAEHGRDVSDPHGRNRKYRWLRRLMAPMISRFVPVSEDLGHWLQRDVGIPAQKIVTIHNGIDTTRYAPAPSKPGRLPWATTFTPAGSTVIGTVGRLDAVKAFDTLIEAFAILCQRLPDHPLRLVIVGDGPERDNLAHKIQTLQLQDQIQLLGARDDIPAILQALDIYVCSSIAEGIALTILEAMATSLPVVATRVGGNPELVVPGDTGTLVPAGDADELATALIAFAENTDAARTAGCRAREHVCRTFSLQAMTMQYCQLYDRLLTAPLASKSRQHEIHRN